jgi:CheY-like chemotaxis protein
MARQHVFVVNGSPPFLDIMRELLQDERYNVTTTNFVPRTFEQIEALQPALLVIDIVVGEQAGWDLLERLHREASTNRMPVLVVSTDPGLLDRAQEQTERYGGQAYLAKPFDLEEMLRVIQGLIGLA